MFIVVFLSFVFGSAGGFVATFGNPRVFACPMVLPLLWSSSTILDDVPSSLNRHKPKAPVFGEACDSAGITLTRFMIEVATLNPEIKELTTLFDSVDTACKAISNLVKRSQLPSFDYFETHRYEREVDEHEDQKKLDAQPLTSC